MIFMIDYDLYMRFAALRYLVTLREIYRIVFLRNLLLTKWGISFYRLSDVQYNFTGEMIRIFAIFKKTIYISALEPFLQSNGIEVVASCSNLALANDQYKSIKPDIVLMDANWPEGIHSLSGDSVIRQLRLVNPDVRIIAATCFFDSWTLSKLKAQGIQGYFYKNMENTLERIRECILHVNDGERYFAEEDGVIRDLSPALT
jgi:CheY-like chemotaxis protein